VIGGPAQLSGKLGRGDEILRIDGIDCVGIEMLHKHLRGSDEPGSTLLLTVRKAATVCTMSLPVFLHRASCTFPCTWIPLDFLGKYSAPEPRDNCKK